MYTEEIHNLLNVKLKEESFLDCFLVAIEQKGKNIWVYLDSDKIVTFDICKAISRYLEAIFDEKGWFGEDYLLEVSSADLTRPITLSRQYIKNIQRDLKVVTMEGTTIEGKIVEADEDKVVLEFEEIVKELKKKIKTIRKVEIPYSNIKEAKIIARI